MERNIKDYDWYDLEWYIRKITLHLDHFYYELRWRKFVEKKISEVDLAIF
jgi:hypothetical protein